VADGARLSAAGIESSPVIHAPSGLLLGGLFDRRVGEGPVWRRTLARRDRKPPSHGRRSCCTCSCYVKFHALIAVEEERSRNCRPVGTRSCSPQYAI